MKSKNVLAMSIFVFGMIETSNAATLSVERNGATLTYDCASYSQSSDASGNVKIVCNDEIKPNTPQCTLTSSSSSIISGATASLVVSCSPMARGYTWTNTQNTTSRASIVSVSPIVTTTYTVVGRNAYGPGNTASFTLPVTSPTGKIPTIDKPIEVTPASTKLPSSMPIILQGKNDGIIDIQGNKALVGWACVQGFNDPIDVKIYRGVIGSGAKVYIETIKANLANNSSAISTACQNAGNHGFQYTIPDSLKVRWSGQELFAEVVSPSATAANIFLQASSDSPSRRIPALPILNVNQFAGNYTELIGQTNSDSLPVYANYGITGQTPVGNLLDYLYLGGRYIGTDFLTTPDNGTTNNSGIWSNSSRTKMVINTTDLQNRGLYTSITGGGPHVWIQKAISVGPYPWFASNQDLILQVNALMPTVQLTANGVSKNSFPDARTPVTQLCFGFYLFDDTTGKSIAYIIPIYESRGPYSENIGNDTSINFASSPLLESSKYSTKSPQSKSMQSKPYGGYIADNFFRVHISAANLTKAINDANNSRSAGLSTDLKNYRVTQAGLLFELPNYVSGASNVSEAQVAGFSVYLNRY